MLANVILWGRRIGVVSLEHGNAHASFEYDPEFIGSGIEVSPLKMPLGKKVYQFPELSRRTFHGLPGLLSDSLPDKYGHAVIDAWLESQGREPSSFSALERLCYIGRRGIGALEFEPSQGPSKESGRSLKLEALVKLASDILSKRKQVIGNFDEEGREGSLREILRVGTSAGGARAKAVIAWNPETNEIRSGQIDGQSGFDYWLLKFDGVSGNRDKELEDPKGYGKVEYAYSLMAKACGIEMSECRLLEDGDRRHFMTKRFDRVGGSKLHMQSLGALAHYDYNHPGLHSYEQAFAVMRKLELPNVQMEEQFRRMVFNIVTRNQDDHVKNIAFLMDKKGVWKLSPAFDLIYSYNPNGDWTSSHQMSVNGKQDRFDMEDLVAASKSAFLKRGRAKKIYHEVRATVDEWQIFAEEAEIQDDWGTEIASNHRVLK